VATLNLHTAQPDDDVVPTPSSDRRRLRRGAPSSRVAYGLGIAAVCALATVNLLTGVGTAPASADEQKSVAVADALGLDGASAPVTVDAQRLRQVTASR
jgi:hypothetical protein